MVTITADKSIECAPYLARINGPDPKWGLDRSFVPRATHYRSRSGATGDDSWTVGAGIYEIGSNRCWAVEGTNVGEYQRGRERAKSRAYIHVHENDVVEIVTRARALEIATSLAEEAGDTGELATDDQ